ncbi:MAG TPA: NUDIX domain-containing protein [Solirubrobacteraceae bacterium]|jgi:8-oxo-dGTP pyrophosphatase MutT (NUDIX family)|nr:NUDIX domain-containing protein [Solirubrobacteraceae bacterium]
MSSEPTPPVTEREVSAGGVVVRGREVLAIVPVKRSAEGERVLALPKGHFDPGETSLQAAEREVREETGVNVKPLGELGEARYWYTRGGHTIGKSVTFFLFAYAGGDIADHDEEVEEVRWLELLEAERALTHAAEREIVGRALAFLEEESQDR